MIKIHLSKLLGECRWNQSELARVTGIRLNTIGEWYNELAERINLEHLDKICEALNCSSQDLFEYIPNDPRLTDNVLYVKEQHGSRKLKR